MHNEYQKLILEKLGEAIYIHRAHIKTAQKASEAVDYLKEQGVFDAPKTEDK